MGFDFVIAPPGEVVRIPEAAGESSGEICGGISARRAPAFAQILPQSKLQCAPSPTSHGEVFSGANTLDKCLLVSQY
jgi:hypothetical protein